MSCIKTGCHIFIEQYGEYAYGDAFAFDGYSPQNNRDIALKEITVEAVHVFRLVQRSFTPLHPNLHFTVHNIGEWWDKKEIECQLNNSVLVSDRTTNHSYDGKELG